MADTSVLGGADSVSMSGAVSSPLKRTTPVRKRGQQQQPLAAAAAASHQDEEKQLVLQWVSEPTHSEAEISLLCDEFLSGVFAHASVGSWTRELVELVLQLHRLLWHHSSTLHKVITICNLCTNITFKNSFRAASSTLRAR